MNQELNTPMDTKKTKTLLFVCLGNICRSPSAEAVMNAVIKKANLSSKFICDSAGIIGNHEGNSADSRMRLHAARRSYDLTSISRQFRYKTDFDKFDLIIGMDDQNIADLQSQARHEADLNKIVKMTDYCSNYKHYTTVPDPYYGGEEGFELVLDLLEDACDGLLNHLNGKI
ncbi:low molecular weight protein-tyrosine-phosphatase [Ancylomarina sp. 16SWW S1-10-2]|uniref:low molecular weight protein-tyrosine-phosphatase n=1 Tax=Ancylomarina sp. 16SWW S1-10-2 TaxID=2499681 RepID=UPI001E4340BE|nr:low molecular weight protein-tyrosine-phosphatase [Ancylomarina sp. 16SWW S1-10-2]